MFTTRQINASVNDQMRGDAQSTHHRETEAMKRLITIVLAVFAIGVARAEIRAESVSNKVLAMCSKNRTNREICDYVAIESNILNLCFLRRDGELSALRFDVQVTKQLNLQVAKSFRQELLETSRRDCVQLAGVKIP